MGKLIVITAGKGGCGKTSFAVNLAATLALQGKKTLLLDFNIGLRNVDIYLGLEDKVLFDFGDYLSGTCKLGKAIVASEEIENLSLLSCPQIKDIKGLSKDHVGALIRQLKKRFEYIIADTQTGIGENFRNIAACADRSVLVVTPDYSSIRNGDTVDKRVEALGVRDRCHVINRVSAELSSSSTLPNADTIEKTIKTPLIGIITEDVNIHLGNNAGCPVVTARDSYIAKNFQGIAGRLLEGL